jgi:3-dehydroquinate dehydratase-2
MRVLVVNGPNLDRLGTREPEVYGSTTLAELERSIDAWAGSLDIVADHFQSNHEGKLIDAIHESDHDAIIVNPGALTHTSRALADALAAVDVPVVEVHISNVKEREIWRRHSVLEDVAAYSIYGRGMGGYRHALRHIANRTAQQFETISYGPHRDNLGDVRRGGSGLIVLVHGGFWRHEWTRDTMESLAVDLTRRGHNTWNIEYRRIGTGGGWPGSAQDVLTALEFIPRLGLGVAAATVVGHSAGGYLGMWAGDRTGGVAKVIGLAPLTDLDMHSRSGLFGAGEAQLLLDSGAPSALEPETVSVACFHGAEDDLVPPEHSSRLASRRATYESVPGGHFELLDPARRQWEGVVEQIERS